MSYRIPVMLGFNSKKSYEKLVAKYKYLNKTTQVDDFLTKIFDRAFKELENQTHGVCGTGKQGSQISLQLNDALEKFYYEFGRPEVWTEIFKCKLKIPISTIESIVGRAFSVRGRDSINRHKKALMEEIGLTQERIGNNHFAVFKGFFGKDAFQMTLKNWLEPLIEKIHAVGEISLGEIEEIVDYDSRKIQTFKEEAPRRHISWYVKGAQIIYCSEKLTEEVIA